MASNKRVCIIGAGPSGMSLLSAFMYAKQKGDEIPELVCFEKQGEIGGLWNYSWRTGLDQYGEVNHGSMYRHLWSNGPKECLEMADYTFDEHFKKPIPSFPPRPVLRDYLLGKAKKYGIEKFVRTKHVVRNVEENKSDGKFTVTYEKLEDRKRFTETFDYVCIGTGHFSVPSYPSYSGLETFPGIMLHAHDFKDANAYKDKRVVLIGSRYSGEDIALQLYKFGAKEAIICHRTNALGWKWPEEIKEKPLPSKIDGSIVHFIDGTTYEADVIIFCTGYQHHFPFMSDQLRLNCSNVTYPDHLYKGCIFNNSPNIIYLGMQFQAFTFNMFDAETWYVRDFILRKIQIPSKEERDLDIKKWHSRCLSISFLDLAGMIDFQRDFIADLHTYTDYPKHDLNGMAETFKLWMTNKQENILTFRDKRYKSCCTGTMGAPLYATWMEAKDDSLERIVNSL